jgi:dTDP-glucose 4,6-dehydratase
MILPTNDLAHVLNHMRAWDKLRAKRVFLSGASGFVGAWLSQSLEYANQQLGLGAELIRVPRTELPPGRFDYGIHAAKADDYRADVDGTRRILDFAARCGATRFLFTSSGAVYGSVPVHMTHVPEDFAPAPETAYGRAKLEGELLCAQYAQQFGLAAIIARMFAFLGPALPLNANFAIGNFIRDAMAGGPITVKGDGTARRSYLYAADMAVWLWTLLLEGESAKPYNVGSPDALSIAELARLVVENTNPRGSIVTLGGEVPGAGSVYVPSVERAARGLQLRPLVPLDEGIRRMFREMACAPATRT